MKRVSRRTRPSPAQWHRRVWCAGLLAALISAGPAQSAESKAMNETAMREALTAFIQREMDDKKIPALSIALVDDQRVVWAQGFGMADPGQGVKADADTVYRVGSVSKLFTDIAVMQQVEQGRLDLDAPVGEALPEFHPANPFATPVTLRQLMAHGAGIVREPPVGNYFDANLPDMAATVASLNDTTLVYAPGTRSKYSNAGVAVVGRTLEWRAKQPFSSYMQQAVLAPLGMDSSGFAPPTSPQLAKAMMWTVDGRQFAAPTFPLGTSAAGNLQSSANDMAKFLAMLFADGRGAKTTLLQPATLHSMWTPAAGADCSESCFGIGFLLRKVDGHRAVGHGGAVYGFSTQLSALPDDKLGVVVMASKDAVNPVVERIADSALRALLALRAGTQAVLPAATLPVPKALAQRLAGRYRSADGAAVELTESAGELTLLPLAGGSPQRLRMADGRLLVDGALSQGGAIEIEGNALLVGGRKYTPVAASKPAPVSESWRGLIGEYGWDHNTLYVFEKDRQLWALIEWFEYDPLRPVGDDEFQFPDNSMYVGERIRFRRDAKGHATRAIVAGIDFPRRAVGPGEGAPQLFIKPLRPVPELLAEAQRATPPAEPGPFLASDLVDVAALDPSIKLDVRYAGENNFLRSRFYAQAQVFLQRPAAEAVVRAHRKLAAQGYGLLLHDGYRPWFVTKVFWDATPDAQKEFVANPAEGSRHNRGAAIDLSLYELATGKPVEMVGTYDETTARSYPDYPGGTSLQRWQRRLLRDALEAEGYTVIPNEWWHFDYNDWQRYPIGNASFSELSKPGR